MLNSAYKTAFGDEKMGVCGALRLGFMVHYLMEKYPEEWAQFVSEQSPEGKIIMAYGASLGRWWSIAKLFDNIITHKEMYYNFMEYMGKQCKSDTYQVSETWRWCDVASCVPPTLPTRSCPS